MVNSNESKEFTFSPDQSSHFDLCLYCLNCRDCVKDHWKICRARLDRKLLKDLLK